MVCFGQTWVCAACKPNVEQRLRETGELLLVPAADQSAEKSSSRVLLVDVSLSLFRMFCGAMLLLLVVLSMLDEPKFESLLWVEIVLALVGSGCGMVGNRWLDKGRLSGVSFLVIANSLTVVSIVIWGVMMAAEARQESHSPGAYWLGYMMVIGAPRLVWLVVHSLKVWQLRKLLTWKAAAGTVA